MLAWSLIVFDIPLFCTIYQKIAIFFSFASALQSSYLYTVLVVAFDFGITPATQISTVYGFTAFVTGPLAGIAAYYTRRLKPFVLAGAVIYTVACGLMLRYRSGIDTSARAGVVAGQVLLGLGAGLFSYAASVGMQVALKHDHVAVMIALFLACHNIGGSFGGSVSGAIWRQTLPAQLAAKIGDTDLAAQVFEDPFVMAAQYSVGTVTSTAIIQSYQHVERLLCGTSLGLCIPLIFFCLATRAVRLNETQTLNNSSGLDQSRADQSAIKEDEN